jgi:hypothetical protein
MFFNLISLLMMLTFIHFQLCWERQEEEICKLGIGIELDSL